MDFKISGIKNTVLIVGQSFEKNLTVFYLGGKKEEVKLSVSSLPPGITLDLSKENGEPDFGLTETIHVDANADTGVFPITITAIAVNSTKTFSKTFTLSVIPVPPIPNAAPVISLVNGNYITPTLNVPFTDPGFVATDNEDGIITNNVIVYGTVNKDSSANYLISYVVYDSAGAKDSVVRTVHVRNEAEFMNGLYTLTPVQPLLPACLSNMKASITLNNKLVGLNALNCYTANLNMDINVATKHILINSQSALFGSTMHTYTGGGNFVVIGTAVQINLNYTDNFVDTLGNNIIVNRAESYLKL